MYQRYFGPSQRSKYAVACRAGIFGLIGTIILFFPLLYNLYTGGEQWCFYCNLGVASFFVIHWVILIAVTKHELIFSVAKTNYILFFSFFVLTHSIVYGIKLCAAFRPSLFSAELLGIVLYLSLHLVAAVLLFVNGAQSCSALSSRYTRLYRKVTWKRNLFCLLGILLGLLAGGMILILG